MASPSNHQVRTALEPQVHTTCSPEPPYPASRRARRRPAFVLVAAAASLVLFAWLGRTDVYNPDEPREVEMAREMLVTGDLVVPRLNGDPFLEKPPLFYWLVSGAYRMFGGPSQTAARVVPALAGVLTILLTFHFARSLLGASTAKLSALVLLTSFLFFYTARRSMIDMPLTLATTLATVGLHRGITEQGRARARWIVVGCAGLAIAVLFKGIVGAGIPGLAALGWIAARRDWKGVSKQYLVPGVALALVPITLWVAELHARLGMAAVREFVLVNNVLRFIGGASKGHQNPIWYYPPRLLVDMAPWSVILLFALAAAFTAAVRQRTEVRDLLLWFAIPLVVLSLASTKRGLYLLPIYPPAAILVAWWLTRHADVPGLGRRVGHWLLFAAMSMAVCVVLGLGIAAHPGGLAAPLVVLALVAWPLAAAWRAARTGNGGRLGLFTALTTAIVFVAAMAWAVPSIVNGGVSARAAGSDLRELSQAGDRIALYHFKEGMLGGFLFYSERTYPNLLDAKALAGHLAGNDPTGHRSLALMRVEDFEEVAGTLPFPVAEERRYVFPTLPGAPGSSGYVLAVRSHTGS